MRFLSFDIGLSYTGFTLIDTSLKLLKTFTFSVDNDGELVPRAAAMARNINIHIRQFSDGIDWFDNPIVLSAEFPTGGAKSSIALRDMMIIFGVMIGIMSCQTTVSGCYHVKPSNVKALVKQTLGLKEVPSKDDICLFGRSMAQKLISKGYAIAPFNNSHHAMDSLAVALLTVNQFASTHAEAEALITILFGKPTIPFSLSRIPIK